MEDELIKKLMTSIKCNVCNQPYQAENISVIGHQGDLWFLNAVCSDCRTQCLVAATVKQSRVANVITDLSEAEARKFKNSELTADDVLDMHNFLKNFNGNFSRILGRSENRKR